MTRAILIDAYLNRCELRVSQPGPTHSHIDRDGVVRVYMKHECISKAMTEPVPCRLSDLLK